MKACISSFAAENSPADSLRIRKERKDMAADKKQLPPGISLRKDSRYQARYTFNGKRHTIYGKDLKEVQRKLRDAKVESPCKAVALLLDKGHS